MKFLKLSFLTIATLAFAACTSNDDATEQASKLENGGSVKINISLPQTTTTRAAIEPPFDDGSANEYNVKSADIALYANVGGTITCVGVQHFGKDELQFSMVGTSTDNITSMSAIVKLPSQAITPTLALAIVNDCEGCSVPTVGQAYSDFVKAASAPKVGISDDGYFMMTNSVYAVTNGSNQEKKDLQPIDPQSISRNQNTIPTSSTTIYVERVNAKVQVKMDLANEATYASTYPLDGTTGLPTITFKNNDVLVVDGWDLTVTNKTYYPVKQFTNDDVTDWNTAANYQMYNLWNSETNYRSYWAVDPNYKKADYTGTNNFLGMLTEFNYKSFNDIKAKASDIKYCLENTFDVADQNKNQTTAVILRGTYQLAGQPANQDIYAIQSKAYNPTDAKSYLASRLNAAGFKCAGAAIDGAKITISADATTNVVSFTYSDGNFTDTGGATKTITEAIAVTFGSKKAVKFYPGGKCFYTIQIKNFGDNVKLYDAGGTYFVYNGKSGINSADKLGRYGVVRNTWYILTINSISGLGSPAPVNPDQPINPDPNYPNPNDPTNPDDPTNPNNPTPDDTENYYIAAQIKILPWAIRTQGADL